ncbi:hypothetical protein IFM89_039944 [Coptis chinensis]|uniref:Uncharacterized protein n=1 Tax=Coptis chinensis TaxID=261450 RepID=A0A835GX57_9MAGN|nr:hypothetical protein IFM89_039944 [Coptis chinensis]
MLFLNAVDVLPVEDDLNEPTIGYCKFNLPLTPSDALKLLDFFDFYSSVKGCSRSLCPPVVEKSASSTCKHYYVPRFFYTCTEFSISDLLPIYLLSGYLFVLQIIESRVSLFSQLFSYLVFWITFCRFMMTWLMSQILFSPTIYEDKDESDEDEPDDATETDNESDETPPINGFSDLDVSDGMSE